MQEGLLIPRDSSTALGMTYVGAGVLDGPVWKDGVGFPLIRPH